MTVIIIYHKLYLDFIPTLHQKWMPINYILVMYVEKPSEKEEV